MTILEILAWLDGEGPLPPSREEARCAAELIRRLLAGDFTKEEIHGFCHNLGQKVNVYEFATGCAEYQRKLYGYAPDRDCPGSSFDCDSEP